jgi:hypothetical protein
MRNEEVVAALENIEASIEAALARGFRQIHEDLERIHQAIKTTNEVISESESRRLGRD